MKTNPSLKRRGLLVMHSLKPIGGIIGLMKLPGDCLVVHGQQVGNPKTATELRNMSLDWLMHMHKTQGFYFLDQKAELFDKKEGE